MNKLKIITAIVFASLFTFLFSVNSYASGENYQEVKIESQIRFEVTLPSGQQYVEIFVRQNGIQNVAENIVNNQIVNTDGTTTYYYVKNGFKSEDVVEYRFYSYMPNSPGVFLPGPGQDVWVSAATQKSASAPTAPTLSGAAVVKSIYLNWTPSSSAQGISHYVLYEGNDIYVDNIDPNTTSLKLYGAEKGRTYRFTLKAVDSMGNISAPSNEVYVLNYYYN